MTKDEATLRDQFAMNSPFGVNQALDIINGVGNRDGARIEHIAKILAHINYVYADAMLAERSLP